MLPLLSTDCHRLLDVLFSLSSCADCLVRQCAQWLRMLALEQDDLFGALVLTLGCCVNLDSMCGISITQDVCL